MADVRKEGGQYRTIRRVYRDKESGFGRVLVVAEGKLLRADEVREMGLEIEAPEAVKPAEAKVVKPTERKAPVKRAAPRKK